MTHWHDKITEALEKSHLQPTWEEGFSFPWQDVSAALSEALRIPELKLAARPSPLKKTDSLTSGMGAKPVVFGIELSPLTERVQWVMALEDISDLAMLTLSTQRHEKLLDPRLEIGFYQYLLLETLEAIENLQIFPQVGFRLVVEEDLPEEHALVLDVSITLPSKTIYGRLVASHNFLEAFKNYEPIQQMPILTMPGVQGKELELRIEAGSCDIAEEEWAEVMPGDFVALDRSSYDPAEEKGSVTFLLGETPVLRGRLKPDGIKILDDAAFYEETAPLESEAPETEMIPSEEPAEEPAPSQMIPLSVEVGRLRLTLGKLLETKPGEILDLLLRPQQGVDITTRGKRIGQGELLKLGDTVGIRVLDIDRS